MQYPRLESTREPELRPVAANERLAALDVIRGWALIGVLIANVHEVLSGRRYMPGQADTALRDVVATKGIEIFISARSATLLTFLFGVGFAIQLMRGDERRRLFVRRMLVMLAIGTVHLVFLWWGDVTWHYAVVGLALLAFRRVSDRALLIWALALVLVPRLIVAIPEIGDAIHGALPHPADRAAYQATVLAAMRGHDLTARISAHLQEAGYFVTGAGVWYFPWVLGRFLLGYYAGRRRLFERDGAAHLALFRRLLIAGLGLGIAATAANLVRHSSLLSGYDLLLPTKLALTALGELGWLGTAAAYASAIVLLLQRPGARRWLLVLAPVGRMPLTTYLTQSVATTFVFYGWGLGLTGTVGAAGCVAISIAIFALQILVARWWLRRFRFGPAEWLWRTLAYGRVQPMRPSSTAIARASGA